MSRPHLVNEAFLSKLPGIYIILSVAVRLVLGKCQNSCGLMLLSHLAAVYRVAQRFSHNRLLIGAPFALLRLMVVVVMLLVPLLVVMLLKLLRRLPQLRRLLLPLVGPPSHKKAGR